MNQLFHKLEGTPVYQSMSPEKKEFLRGVFDIPLPTGTQGAMTFLMSFAKQSKQQNISFSQEEVLEIFTLLSQNATPEEARKYQNLVRWCDSRPKLRNALRHPKMRILSVIVES